MSETDSMMQVGDIVGAVSIFSAGTLLYGLISTFGASYFHKGRDNFFSRVYAHRFNPWRGFWNSSSENEEEKLRRSRGDSYQTLLAEKRLERFLYHSNEIELGVTRDLLEGKSANKNRGEEDE